MDITQDEVQIVQVLRSMRPNEQLLITKKKKESPNSFVMKLNQLILVERNTRKLDRDIRLNVE